MKIKCHCCKDPYYNFVSIVKSNREPFYFYVRDLGILGFCNMCFNFVIWDKTMRFIEIDINSISKIISDNAYWLKFHGIKCRWELFMLKMRFIALGWLMKIIHRMIDEK